MAAAWLAVAAAAGGSGWPAPLRAEALHRYSGQVTEIDLGRGLLVVEELGRRGVPVRRETRIAPDTPVVSASRLRPGDIRGGSAFGEMPISFADVLQGDFVVVEAVVLDGDWIARRVTIVETRRGP